MKFSPQSQSILGTQYCEDEQDSSVSVYLLDELATDDQAKTSLYLGQESEPTRFLAKMADRGIVNLVQGLGPLELKKGIARWVRLMKSRERFFSDPGGVHFGTTFHKKVFRIQAPPEKILLRSRIGEVLGQVTNESGCEVGLTVFEELYMNAMLDAPREAGGSVGNREVLFEISWDDVEFVISCRDSWGSLDAGRLLKKMADVHARGAAASMNMNRAGGAGIGSMILLQNADSIVFGVWPTLFTLVSCRFARAGGFRSRMETLKSLCFYTYQELKNERSSL